MTPGGRTRSERWIRLVPAGYSLLLAVIVLGPLLGSGCLLLRDAVATPRSYLTDTALGLGDAAPRAVPQDGLLAALSPIVGGGLVVRVVLLLAVWTAGWGAAVLARTLLRVGIGPQLVAATVAIWNPYVAERLLQGHWSLLAGYAALPWTALAAQRLRVASESVPAEHISMSATAEGMAARSAATGHPRRRALRRWAALGGLLAAAGLTPTGALLAGVVALTLVGRRNLLGTLGLWIVASAPWLVATALSGAGAEPSDPAGIAAFAARAEPGLGTLGSLAGLAGIWNGDAVPGSRTTLFALVGTAVLLSTVLLGVRAVTAAGDPVTRRARRVAVGLAVVAIALPALGATGWGLHIGEFLVTRIPGTGLLRDTQKYVALAVPAYALCAAAGCRMVATTVTRRLRSSENAAATGPLAAALLVALVLLALPDLAWGVGGALRPVHYPPGWARAAAVLDGPGDVAVLPAGMFREFPYSGRVPVLDPAPRLLPADVVQTGELPVHGRVVAGEGTRARTAQDVLLRGGSPRQLAAAGVGWVLVERTTPGPLGDSARTLAGLRPVFGDGELALYQVPGPIDERGAASGTRRATAEAAHWLWVILLIAGLAGISRRRIDSHADVDETGSVPTEFDITRPESGSA